MSQAVHNMEAERSLLATLLADPFTVAANLHLRSTDFYSRAHGALYSAVVSMCKAGGDPTDRAALISTLRERRLLADSEEMKAVTQLTVAQIDGLRGEQSDDAFTLARNISRASQLRTTQRMMLDQLAKIEAWDGQTDPRKLIDAHVSEMQKVAMITDTSRLTQVGLAAREDRQRNRDRAAGLIPGGLTFWIPELTARVGPIDPRSLVIVGGRTGHGKTMFACQWARHIAETMKQNVCMASLEMNAGVLGRRLLSGVSRIPMSVIKAGQGAEATEHELDRANSRMDKWPLWIDDKCQKDVNAIVRWMRKCRIEHNCQVFIVDYVQIMSDDESQRSDTEAKTLARMCYKLREFVDTYDAQVIVLSQVNRSVNTRKKVDRMPTASDLSGGGLEAAADVILTLWRPGEDDEKARGGEVEPAIVNICKGRECRTGPVPIGWRVATAEFTHSHLVDENGATLI